MLQKTELTEYDERVDEVDRPERAALVSKLFTRLPYTVQ